MAVRRTERHGQTTAEWVTFAISATLLAVLIGAILWLERSDGDAPPQLEITGAWDEAYEHDGTWYLPVTVENVGDEASDVARVDVVRMAGGEEAERSDLEFTFLSGGERVEATVAFDEQPSADSVEFDVVSSTTP